TVAPASGTNPGGGPNGPSPPLNRSGLMSPATVAPAGSVDPEGTGFVPVPPPSRITAEGRTRCEKEPLGLGIPRPRRDHAAKGRQDLLLPLSLGCGSPSEIELL